MTKELLLLVDGSSYLYRAFHAMPDLRNPKGEPTGAIYGMINMLRRLRTELPTSHIACVFDAKGPTFRDEWYPQYKANRSPMPEDLVKQIEPIHAVVKALGWPVIMVSGVEADDVIGTLAKKATAVGWKTVISTGDKDLAQLVDESVTLINTMTNEKLDIQGVIDKFGIAPHLIVDYLTIIGDTVDNVPGVPKAGPKTAVKWLTEFGDLDSVIAQSDQIKGVVGENLRSSLEWLEQAKRLLTVKVDCELDEHLNDLSELQVQPENHEELKQLFIRYGFKTWLKEYEPNNQGFEQESAGSSQQNQLSFPSQPVITSYESVTSKEQLTVWLDKIKSASLTCVDTETTGLDPMRSQLVGISLSVEAGKACYIPLKHMTNEDQLDREETLETLRPWLEDPQAPKLGQNLKFDWHILANHGITLRGIVHDTLLQSYVYESHRSHDMDSLAQRHLGVKTITFEEVCGKGASQIGFDQVDIATATQYAAEDADITLRLHQHLWPMIESDQPLCYVYQAIEIPTMLVLARMERNGILIDSAKLAQQGQVIGLRLLELEKEIHTLAGQPFNIQSPKQIGEILFQVKNLPIIKKTPGGAPSTDEEVLQKLSENYPLPARILDYRSLAKLQSTYVEKLPRMADSKTGRVHTNYAQAVAATGRLASNEPNLQNIPVRTEEGRKIREAFIARPGWQLISADYSQIELRIMAHIAQDANLLEAFAQGRDIHQATAAEIFGVPLEGVTPEQRRYAKVINFGLIYGMSAFGLASNLGIERSAAQTYIDTYFGRYPGVAKYMADTRVLAKEKGYVETIFGRRLWLPEINSSNGMRRQGAERAAINAPMQGTAADLIKLSMIAVQSWLEAQNLQTQMLLQVHDELVLEVPPAELELVKMNLRNLMTQVATLRVPLEVGIGVGTNWEEAH
ncbi:MULTISPECIES: DNA polymerase I [unclassified Polynucleobacter]|uniref:DNA polymerase I n=1 Tax=unclassified Polynucleobacter TaxID=2640945 RepID=UPI0024934CF1|nr:MULTISPECIES: DNA polymerase I [unclassified Polynucleobacter]